jgi:(E)-4-hydroxy-3-methylbut-2-enyl-diphosphate synthase
VPHIRERLERAGVTVPLIGDFHYIGHKLLPIIRPAPRRSQVPHQSRQCRLQGEEGPQFARSSRLAIRYGKPVRIGVNWGSLDQELLTRLMDENAAPPAPLDRRAP